MKIALKIIAILSFAVAILTGSELLNPIRNQTASVNKVITLKTHAPLAFETYYDYGYRIKIIAENLNETIMDSMAYVLQVNSTKEKFQDLYSVGNAFIDIGSFRADEGDNCRLTFTSIGSKLRGQKVRLIIDVNGGGPSVGNVWAKELRPVVSILFWVSTGLFVLMLLVLLMIRRSDSQVTATKH